MAEATGQEPGSQPGATETGQEQMVADSPSADLTDSIVQAARKMEESAASETVTEPVEEKPVTETEKPLPYDQDPKWLSARAAEKRQGEILEKHGFEEADDLEAALDRGMTITEALGDRDAKKLLQDFTELKEWKDKVENYWAEQERTKAEEDLDPDELAAKYKQELADLKKAESDKFTEKQRLETAKSEIAAFNETITSAVEKQGFEEGAAEIAKLLMGVDNPFNTVDISDKKAVKAMAVNGAKKLSDFIATIKQSAIDEYSAGKSEFAPMSPVVETKPAVAAKDEEIPKELNVRESFGLTTKRLLEKLSGGLSP